MRCRLCGHDNLSPFLDLGFTPPADQFLIKEQLNEPETYYPLTVVRCDQCFFVQLSYVVHPGILYRNDYPYESSMTRTGVTHFDAFAESVMEMFHLSSKDFVIDIGSNVGVLLSGFKNRGCRILGIDPAENIAQIANHNGIPTLPVFFNNDVALNVIKKHGKAKIVTASNVFAHIDNLNLLMKDIDTVLDEDGIFIVEGPYLVHLLAKLEYDTIYHEHLSYLSLLPLIPFFKKCGFELFDVRQFDIHGGSIRLFVSRALKRDVSPEVNELVNYEKVQKIHSMDSLFRFAEKVEINRRSLLSLLVSLKEQGKKIAAVSAPAKGMTLLNYCKIGNNLLEFVTEKSTLKINKFTPGMHLPVLPDSALVSEKIDYALLLAWNFKDEIMRNLTEFKDGGGRFIIPIPEPVVV